MSEQISYKQFFKNYLILIGVMLVVFTLLIYLSIVSKKSWNNNLKTAVEVVLDEKQPNTWSVGNNIDINNPFTMSGACYEVTDKECRSKDNNTREDSLSSSEFRGNYTDRNIGNYSRRLSNYKSKVEVKSENVCSVYGIFTCNRVVSDKPKRNRCKDQ